MAGGHEVNLADQVVGWWPTPRSVEGHGEPADRQGPKLSSVSLRWPTPVSRDATGHGYQQRRGVKTLTLPGASGAFPQDRTTGTLGSRLQAMGGRFRLNPQFVEWLMGLPPGWISRAPNS